MNKLIPGKMYILRCAHNWVCVNPTKIGKLRASVPFLIIETHEKNGTTYFKFIQNNVILYSYGNNQSDMISIEEIK